MPNDLHQLERLYWPPFSLDFPFCCWTISICRNYLVSFLLLIYQKQFSMVKISSNGRVRKRKGEREWNNVCASECEWVFRRSWILHFQNEYEGQSFQIKEETEKSGKKGKSNERKRKTLSQSCWIYCDELFI